MINSIMKINRRAFTILLWLLIWGAVSHYINNQVLFPSPRETFDALLNLIVKKYFWITVFSSVSRVLIGLLFSIVLGVILGLFSGMNVYLEEILMPFISSIKATPVMSIIILALVWFKASNVSIFTTILICFPIIYTNAVEGIKSTDLNLLQMADVYNVKKIYIVKDIYIPTIKSYVVSGILMCLGLAFKVSVASEVLSTPKYSIGVNILNSKAMLETEELFAWTIVVIILSLLFELIFKIYIKNTHNLRRYHE
ncbi:ABC transporter permease [Clostridium botulinum C/D str. BKT12695]|nr:ABC transporter permease [Clostridium botulinum C/D str. BKT12695]